MVVIRLARVGKKNSPAYRVVVAEKQRAVKRKFIEVIGHYNPIREPKEIVIDKDRALFWLEKGAQPSDTVRNLMVDQGILKKSEKAEKKYAKKKKKKELKAEKEGKSPKTVKAPEVNENADGPEEEAKEEKKENSKNEKVETKEDPSTKPPANLTNSQDDSKEKSENKPKAEK